MKKIDEISQGYKKTFATLESSIVLKDLSQFCSLLTPTTCQISTGAQDPLHTARMEGRREVALRILEMLEYDFNRLRKLKHEQRNS